MTEGPSGPMVGTASRVLPNAKAAALGNLPAMLASDQQSAVDAVAAAFELAGVAIVWLEGQGLTVRYANSRAHQLLGPTLDARPFREVVSAGIVEQAVAAVTQSLLYGGPTDVTLHAPPASPLSLHAQPWPRRAPHGVLVMLSDEHGEKGPSSREETPDAAQERAGADRFFHILAHDLRNPIGSAKMSVDGIVRSRLASEPIMKKARRASMALGRADDLIGRCLDVRAAQAGCPLPLERSTCSLGLLAQEAANKANALTPERVLCQSTSPGMGEWDPAYIRRALDDLLYTAGKYCGSHGPLRLDVSEQGIDVRLQGIVLAAAEMHQLTQATPWLTRPEESRASIGMGLALVRLVAEAHGGQLAITSENGQTVFSLKFCPDAASR